MRHEQKPSEDDINKVRPSFDLYYISLVDWTQIGIQTYQVKSVNVAKCRLLTTHKGFCCCVSYTYTASEVATAYIIRYGSPNAKGGPTGGFGVGVESDSEGLGDAALSMLGDGDGALVKGGGSIPVCEGAFVGTAGSGRDSISGSADEVSTVICLVVEVLCRRL